MDRTVARGRCWLLGLLLLAGLPLIVHARVYSCTAANGSVAYQDVPCVSGQRQKVIHLPSHPPPGYVPPPVATTPPPATSARALPPLAHVPPPAPLPALYECVGAVNGKHYLARHPTAPYLAPLGVMGYPPETLSKAYGPSGGAGMSAPGMSKPPIGGPPIAAEMTQVQDPCRPASHARICHYVRGEYDKNQQQLRMAMRDEKPPYEKREQQLASQLRSCQ